MQVSVGHSSTGRLSSDSNVKKYIRSNEARAHACAYIKDVGLATMQARWFEAKSKFEFAEREKREIKT